MKIFLSSHGSARRDSTHLPPGMTLHYYAKHGENLAGEASWKIIKGNGGGPVETVSAPRGGIFSPGESREIHNVYISGMDVKEFRNGIKGAKQPGDKVVTAGMQHDGADAVVKEGLLCENPLECLKNGDLQHTCGGVLQQLRNLGYNEIHMLICRPPGKGKEATRAPLHRDRDRKEDEYADSYLGKIEELYKTWLSKMKRPSAAIEWWDTELTDGQRSQLIAGRTAIQTWRSVSHALIIAEELGSIAYLVDYLGDSYEKKIVLNGIFEASSGVFNDWLKGATAILMAHKQAAYDQLKTTLKSDDEGRLLTLANWFHACDAITQERLLQAKVGFGELLEREKILRKKGVTPVAIHALPEPVSIKAINARLKNSGRKFNRQDDEVEEKGKESNRNPTSFSANYSGIRFSRLNHVSAALSSLKEAFRK